MYCINFWYQNFIWHGSGSSLAMFHTIISNNHKKGPPNLEKKIREQAKPKESKSYDRQIIRYLERLPKDSNSHYKLPNSHFHWRLFFLQKHRQTLHSVKTYSQKYALIVSRILFLINFTHIFPVYNLPYVLQIICFHIFVLHKDSNFNCKLQTMSREKTADHFIFYFQDGFRRLLNIFRGSVTGVGRSINHQCHIMGKKKTTFETIDNMKRQPGLDGLGWLGQGTLPQLNIHSQQRRSLINLDEVPFWHTHKV